MDLYITSFFAAVLAVIYVALSVGVIRQRRAVGASLGDNGNSILLRRIRAHSNFNEYVPLALILLLVNELQGVNAWILIITGLLLTFGRLLHAYGLYQENENFKFRVSGMMATFSSLLILALSLIYLRF